MKKEVEVSLKQEIPFFFLSIYLYKLLNINESSKVELTNQLK